MPLDNLQCIVSKYRLEISYFLVIFLYNVIFDKKRMFIFLFWLEINYFIQYWEELDVRLTRRRFWRNWFNYRKLKLKGKTRCAGLMPKTKSHFVWFSSAESPGSGRKNTGLVDIALLFMRLKSWAYACTCSVTFVLSDSLWPHGLYPAKLLCPWISPGKNTGVAYHALLEVIFTTQWSIPRLLHCR